MFTQILTVQKVKLLTLTLLFVILLPMKAQTYSAKVSSQGQITLPKKLREKLKLDKGLSRINLRYVDPQTVHVDGSSEMEAFIKTYAGIAKPKKGQPSAVDILREMKEDQNTIIDARITSFRS
jgi:bifunctional DNA-binding transcriptional regulator/antitoxin component of YhaV-PrlF toxin-antitoxin module